MTYKVIKGATRKATIALVACLCLSACDDTSKPPNTELKPIPTQANDSVVNSVVASEPRLRAAGEGKDYQWGKDHIFVKLSSAETGGILTLIQDNMKPGFNLSMHFHRVHTEIFYILEGEIEFLTDKASFTAKTGSVVYLPAGTPHAARSSTGARMLMFYAPGGFDGMLAEIENASWLQRVNPFARARRDEKYDFNKGASVEPPVSDSPKPLFLAGGKGEIIQIKTGTSTVKLNSVDTDGLATMTEETLTRGAERVFSLPGNQVAVLYVLGGEVEFEFADKAQILGAGATVYLPAGVSVKLTSSTGAKLLSYSTQDVK